MLQSLVSLISSKTVDIIIGESSKFININQAKLNLLDEISDLNLKKELVVVSFLGKARIGKSTLMNCFVSHLSNSNLKIFNTSNSVKEHCTSGIDFLSIETETKTILLLDIQGLDFKDSKDDCKLMLFVFMISNIIIYNEKGILTNSVLSSFQALTSLVTHIKDNQIKPNLIFRSIDVDSELEDYDPTENLTDMLSEDRTDQYTNVRKSITKLFATINSKPTYSIEKREKQLLNSNDFVNFMNNEENGFKLFCNYLIDQINSSPKHNPSKFIERVKIVIDQINSNKKIDCKIFDLTSAQSEIAIRDWEEKEINSSKYNEITVDGSQLMYELNVIPIINYRNDILDKFDKLFSMATPSIRDERRDKIKNKFDTVINNATSKAKQISFDALTIIYNDMLQIKSTSEKFSECKIESSKTSAQSCKELVNFSKGDTVFYQKDDQVDQVKIVGVHKDDFPNIYYTIAFPNGYEKQTYPNYLSLNKPQSRPKSAGQICTASQSKARYREALNSDSKQNNDSNDIYPLVSKSSNTSSKIAIIDPTQTFDTWYDNNIEPIHKEYNNLINNSKWLSIVKEEFINKIDKLVKKNTIEIKQIFIIKQNHFNDYIDKCLKSIKVFIMSNKTLDHVSNINMNFNDALYFDSLNFYDIVESNWKYNTTSLSLFPQVNIKDIDVNFFDSLQISSILISSISTSKINKNNIVERNLLNSIDSDTKSFKDIISNYLRIVYYDTFITDRKNILPDLLDELKIIEINQSNYVMLKKSHNEIKKIYLDVINGDNDVYMLNLFDHLDKYITLYTQANSLTSNSQKIFANQIITRYIFIINKMQLNKIYIKSTFENIYSDILQYYNLIDNNATLEDKILLNYELVKEIIDILFRKCIISNM
jgi:hypothetical protein